MMRQLILGILMTTSPVKHIVVSVFAIILLVLAASVLATIFGTASERILTVFFISLIAVVGMGVYSGNSGILSFGHLSFMAIGAYAASLLTLPSQLKIATLPKLPEWLATTELGLLNATIIAVLLTSLVALLIGIPIGKLEGLAAVITTLGLLMVLSDEV